MNKITLTLITIAGVLVSACKGVDAVDFSSLADNQLIQTTPPANNTNGFITFKTGGNTINFDLAQGLRTAGVQPRSLDVNASAKAGGNPRFVFHSEESVIGFVPGLNVGNSSITYPADYVDYTDASGTLYSSRYVSGDSFYVYFSGISYMKGGTLTGVFSGSLQSASGAQLKVEDGRFSVTFSN